MIVVLSYYSDGSGKPEVRFFPSGETRAEDMGLFYIADESGLSKMIEVYRIESLNCEPLRIYPNDTITK
jgi:hypothetical protein